MERDQATRMMQTLLKKMVSKDASDLFITVNMSPSAKINGELTPIDDKVLTKESALELVEGSMTEKQIKEFHEG